MNAPFPPPALLPDLLASAGLLVVLTLSGWITRRALKARQDLPPQAVRRWSANVRNALLLVAVVGLTMIWAPQLRTFALSLTAVAVAIVVATKELILCLSGAAFRTFTRAYTIGDYIEIDGIRGEVVDISLLAARLREPVARAGNGQARHMIVPHGLMFANPVRVLARAGGLGEHGFALVFETKIDLFAQIEKIRSAAESVAAPIAQPADRPLAVRDLRVRVTTTELGRLKVEVHFHASPEDAPAAENAMMAAVGSYVLALQREHDHPAAGENGG